MLSYIKLERIYRTITMKLASKSWFESFPIIVRHKSQNYNVTLALNLNHKT
jgi:hypothetical protein